MISRKIFAIFLLLVIFLYGCASSRRRQEANPSEVKMGNIQLILNERTGHFSLYYLVNAQRYDPLFNAREQAASYSSISVDGSVFELGSRQFRPSLRNYNGNPSFVFESPALSVTQIFSPVITASSSVVNGIMITYIIQNTGSQNNFVGLRLLLDTNLGDGRRGIQFITDEREITAETHIESANGERFWLNRGANLSLMGSIINPLDENVKPPDIVYFANWRRLHNTPWRLNTAEGRSFFRDTAVCYIYEPVILESGSSITYTIFLTAEDSLWYLAAPKTPDGISRHEPMEHPAVIEEQMPVSSEGDANMVILLTLQELLQQFISGEIDLGEQDLIEIEAAINRLMN